VVQHLIVAKPNLLGAKIFLIYIWNRNVYFQVELALLQLGNEVVTFEDEVFNFDSDKLHVFYLSAISLFEGKLF